MEHCGYVPVVVKHYGKLLMELSMPLRHNAQQWECFQNAYTQLKRVLVKDKQGMKELNSPLCPQNTRVMIIDFLCDKIKAPDVLQKFLRTVMQRGRWPVLIQIIGYFESLDARLLKKIPAILRTASPLDPQKRLDMTKHLHQQIGHNFFLEYRVDPALLGGFVLLWEGNMLDASISGQLSFLRKHIQERSKY